MKIEVESVSPVERKVTIEVDPDRVAKELEKAYSGLGRRVKLRGFRPGKAPRKVLERHFRTEIEGEVAEKIVQSTFAEAVKVESIDPVAPPHVSITEGVAEGKPLRYTARVEVKPKLSPKDYKGLEVTRKISAVTDEDVTSEITKLQDSLAHLVPVEGRFEAQEGDWAVVDHEGTVDGKPFEGSLAEGVTVKVGAGAMTEGFVEQLKGKKIGESVELEDRLPEDHRNETLRGKTATMKVTLRSLKAPQRPALDDDFVKSLGVEEVSTVEQLRARVRRDLEKQAERRDENHLREELLKGALARNDFEVPPSLIERAIDAMLEGTAQRLSRQGIDIQKLQLDFARMRGDLREHALFQVKSRLLLEAIAEAEKIEVSEEDVQAEITKLAGDLGLALAQAQQQTRGKDVRDALRNKIQEDKTIAVLSSAARFQEP